VAIGQRWLALPQVEVTGSNGLIKWLIKRDFRTRPFSVNVGTVMQKVFAAVVNLVGAYRTSALVAATGAGPTKAPAFSRRAGETPA
jgi:hypothetical protein